MPSVVGMFWRESGKLEQEFREVRDGMPLYYKLAEGNRMGAHHAMEGEIYLLQGDDKSAEESYLKALYAAESMEQDSICYCVYLGWLEWLFSERRKRGDIYAYAGKYR